MLGKNFSKIWGKLRLVLRRLLLRREDGGKEAGSVEESGEEAIAVAAAGGVKDEDLTGVRSGVIGNRATRRARSAEERKYEKRRRKFDKFVEPGGDRPAAVERGVLPRVVGLGGAEVKVEEVSARSTEERLIVDVHHEGGADFKVLYREEEYYGEFNFRDTVLDQLERYFVYLARMKRSDSGAYDFYREVGAHILPFVATPDLWPREGDTKHYMELKALSPWFLKYRPAFGCCAYGTSSYGEEVERRPHIREAELEEARRQRGEFWIPKFCYFMKYRSDEAPPEVQRKSGGDVYVMTFWWDKPDHKKVKYGRCEQYPMFVGADGLITPLRIIDTKMVPIYSKRDGLKKIPRREWRMPHGVDDWAKQHHASAKVFLNNLFVDMAMHSEETAYAMTKVSVTNRKGEHALFSIDPHRMPYFFQDRDYDLTESGLRKRIFHVVRPHVRSDGTEVKMHFRGEREFDWAGYHVRITVPGLDHPLTEEGVIGEGGVDVYWRPKWKKEGLVDLGTIGKAVRARMDGAKTS